MADQEQSGAVGRNMGNGWLNRLALKFFGPATVSPLPTPAAPHGGDGAAGVGAQAAPADAQPVPGPAAPAGDPTR